MRSSSLIARFTRRRNPREPKARSEQESDTSTASSPQCFEVIDVTADDDLLHTYCGTIFVVGCHGVALVSCK